MCVKLKSPLWLGWPLWNVSFSPSRLITGFVTRLTQRGPLVDKELLNLPEHLGSSPVFSGARFTRSVVVYVCFVVRCLSFCSFSFCHCVVCSSSIYGFWLPLWYLQTLLTGIDFVSLNFELSLYCTHLNISIICNYVKFLIHHYWLAY